MNRLQKSRFFLVTMTVLFAAGCHGSAPTAPPIPLERSDSARVCDSTIIVAPGISRCLPTQPKP